MHGRMKFPVRKNPPRFEKSHPVDGFGRETASGRKRTVDIGYVDAFALTFRSPGASD